MKKSHLAPSAIPLPADSLQSEGADSVSDAVVGSTVMKAIPAAQRIPRASLVVATVLTVLVGASACSGGGGGGSSLGQVGELTTKPDGSLFFVDPSRGGSATRLHLSQVFWGRLVDVHDVDAAGNPRVDPVMRDYAINENVRTDATRYLLETNPITQRTRLIIRRQRDAGDTGLGSFESLLAEAADGLAPIVAHDDDGTDPGPFSLAARNGVLVLIFDDLLEDGPEARNGLLENVRVLTGYPPTEPFNGRVLFDANHGAVVSGEFHSTRVLVDLTITSAELSSLPVALDLNAIGLPASLVTTTAPNVSVHIPTRPDFGVGQFDVLRGLSGVPLSATENGPVDDTRLTLDVVRAMRSGNPDDENNGFMLDLNPPEIVGSWPLQVDHAVVDPAGEAGFDFLLDITFATVCRGAPGEGDVIAVGGESLSVTQAASAPNFSGQVLDVHVRNLSDTPIVGLGALVGTGSMLSTFDPQAPVSSGCWVSFLPQAEIVPTTDVDTDLVVVARFSEPMDPGSMSPFDNFFVVRGDSNSVVSATNLVVGETLPTVDLKEYRFVPRLELTHNQGVAEAYHVRISAPTDLAGNELANQLPAVNFTLKSSQETQVNGGTVMRFNGLDELEPIGLNDFRGQFFFDLDRGLIRPRPVAQSSFPADRINPVPSIQVQFPPGVQTPLTPLGSKLQTVWRYCDLGWQVLDETKYNLDVIGLSWAPVGGRVTNDFFDGFEMRLAHSRFQPDEQIDGNLLPVYTNSGLRGDPNFFSDNILIDPLSPQKVVHPRDLGYRILTADLFLASSGTVMLPYPLNRNVQTPVTYTWRDTSVLAKAAPNGKGIPLDIEQGTPLFLENFAGNVARSAQVPSFGLPLLMEYRCYPSDTGVGFNALDISLAINSSAIPSFRSYSSGGLNTAGQIVLRDPDVQVTPLGGFNPTSSPPGKRTQRSDDNAFYIGQLDVVTRISRVHTIWIDTNLAGADYSEPVVLPVEQPLGTSVIIEFRGANSFTINDLAAFTGEEDFPQDASHLNPYGDIFIINAGNNDQYEILGALDFPGSISYLNNIATWLPDIDQVDGAKFVQMRITFVNNIQTNLNPELSAIGIAYRAP